MLDSRASIKSIAKKLDRSTSTISREIKNHQTITNRRLPNLCSNQYGCIKRHVCSPQCRKDCRKCANCIKYCPDYIPMTCTIRDSPPYVCNGCQDSRCKQEKVYYKATVADREYREILSDSRSGFNVTDEQLRLIDQAASPLILQGLSPYHVSQTIKQSVPVSESTLYRMINSTKLQARDIDLINKVKRKPRKYPIHRKMNHEMDSRAKDGHRYADFLTYLEENDLPVVELDCVEGAKEDHAVLLTMHFVAPHMQLAFIMDEHTSNNVVATLDMIETQIGTKMFRQVCPLILTDNGHEFLNREAMERSCLELGTKRTIVFYCEPNRSDEKGHCEKNHTHIRYIIPKGSSLEPYCQADISLMMNHINSYRRKKLFGKSPYDVAMDMFPEDFFILLGLEKIPPEQVLLKPALLRCKVNATPQ